MTQPLWYFTARLSRSRGFGQDAKTAKSTGFSFAAETPEKEKSLAFSLLLFNSDMISYL